MDLTSLLIYATPLLLILVSYIYRRHRHHLESMETLGESVEAGLLDPASLHPVIDPLKCIGCGSCVAACPEMPANGADWLGTPGVATALILFRTIYEEWAIDFDQVYLAGRGAGVEAALSIAGKFPERFAGVIGRAGDAGPTPAPLARQI